jgi:hypothetical protein
MLFNPMKQTLEIILCSIIGAIVGIAAYLAI